MHRNSTMTEYSLRLSEDAIDHRGVARMGFLPSGPVNDDANIAPWIDVPPTPPPKSPARTFGHLGPKISVTSLPGSSRQGSYANSGNYSLYTESQTTFEGHSRRSMEGDAESTRTPFSYSGSSSHSADLRKPKSSITLNGVFSRLRTSKSKSQLAPPPPPEPSIHDMPRNHPSLKPIEPPQPQTSSLFNFRNGSMMSVSKGPRKSKDPHQPPAPGPLEKTKEKKQQYKIDPRHQLDLPYSTTEGIVDIQLDGMEGIVDMHRQLSSPDSAYQMSDAIDFRNPFSHTTPTATRKPDLYPTHNARRISPKTMIPPPLHTHRTASSISSAAASAVDGSSPGWTPPQSWEIEKPGEGVEPIPTLYSSSEESLAGDRTLPKRKLSLPSTSERKSSLVNFSEYAAHTPKARKKRPSIYSDKTQYLIKIHRSGGNMHHIIMPISCTVAELNKELNKRLLDPPQRVEQHRLYLAEGGRERLLAAGERPIVIVRRRLRLAGYEPNDGIEQIGKEDVPFIYKFVYKSQFLGPPEEDLNFESFEVVDLTGRSLRTIPVILHQNADSISSLKLSRNPMLEIPLDFIQSCSSLVDLRLSNMAMQKVPQSVRHSTSLRRLDLSSNRIKDLTEAFLDPIPCLTELYLQNNKLATLPWHFARLRTLVTLNISNNRFDELPKVVFDIESLTTLDVSFNKIKTLPDELGKLINLQKLLLVGNEIKRFPNTSSRLVQLDFLDCRRNLVNDLTIMSMLPKIRTINADHNNVHALELSVGPFLSRLDVSYNDITQLSLVPGPVGRSPYSLTSLDLSYAKLSSLDDIALGTLTSLKTLRLDHNAFRTIPDSLGELRWLETLSCSDNNLDKLPISIGQLQKLETLDAHNNNLLELPSTIWNCASLRRINATSNRLGGWHDPPISHTGMEDDLLAPHLARKGSASSATSIGSLPPLVHSLEKLYLGENILTHESVHTLTIFKELRVLNLSFNEIQELPPNFFCKMIYLEELYLSGNKLVSIPTEDLHRMTRLTTLYLNGNKLLTLPQELGKVKGLSILDVGSNSLKYNINNWEFDWNWNFNKRLKYLNLSGNNRLQIKAESARHSSSHNRMSRDLVALGRQTLSGFKELTSLRVLGLMDVTITTTGADATVDIPEETELRRVRTSLSTVNRMAYGIADSLGRNDVLNMLDLVHEFPVRSGEPRRAIFAMFGRSQPPKGLLPGTSPNKLSKFLRDNFVEQFTAKLGQIEPSKGEGVPDALRRTFLHLNSLLHNYLRTIRRKNSQASTAGFAAPPSASVGFDPHLFQTGASAVVVYFVDKVLYAANVGNALAVVSRKGVAHNLSRRHDPYDRDETAHVRLAEGWVSSSGLINDEVEVSRGFGYFNLIPAVNPRPDMATWNLTERDEFVIIANRSLWDYVPYQIAVDIARTEKDPMIASQKLRDFAISYGADGSTMIMVVMVSDLFPRYAPVEPIVLKQTKRDQPKVYRHLRPEIPAPTGHLALVFTDIRNSTHLWEVNPGMPTAIRLHNELLRRSIRTCGGYEVKTEGDAFMVSFPTAMGAVWWALTVQVDLLECSWPLEILECEDGKEIRDQDGSLLARGLSVRMGIHVGAPSCERDLITDRMDYFGSMVNRSARVNGCAQGGQICVSADVQREINASIFETEPETEYSKNQPQDAIDGIRDIGLELIHIGEVKLKGFEFSESLAAIYPKGLENRHYLKPGAPSTDAASRVQFNVPQMKALGNLCLRLEALSGGRVFRPPPIRKGSIASATAGEDDSEKEANTFFTADPELLLPPVHDQLTDADLTLILDSLALRIENAVNSLVNRYCPSTLDKSKFLEMLLEGGGGLDQRTLEHIASLLQRPC
ncbi:adenylate cyclase [Coprinopsis sp. MPI-PUGE-AT-0042]|nr:adenylate cyclase [Coprinopsis sp. MPI-PUGE-AT-0042]